MLKVTIGQYYPADSFIHRLDARMKLLCTMIFVVVIFFIGNFLGYALAALYLVVVIRVSKVPTKFLLRGLRSRPCFRSCRIFCAAESLLG